MTSPSPDVTAALASLRERWGSAAPRVEGALAIAPRAELALALHSESVTVPSGVPALPASLPLPGDGRVVRTGFPDLDAILGPGGLPRTITASLLGDGSSGKTTLALRLAAEIQAAGGIVAYLDLARSLDPVEAVARGVRLEWLVVLTPETLEDGLAMAGTLLQDRAVDLLLVDLPVGLSAVTPAPGRRAAGPAPQPAAGPGTRPAAGPAPRPAGLAERIRRLAAFARRAEIMLVVLEPPGLPQALRDAIVESGSLRLELRRRAWIRLGQDVVGQRTEVVVARSRFGPPGRRAEVRILYAEGGGRDACLRRDELLREELPLLPAGRASGGPAPGLVRRRPPIRDLTGLDAPPARPVVLPFAHRAPRPVRDPRDATPPPALAAPSPSAGAPARTGTVAGRSDRAGRAAMGSGARPRR